MCASILPDSDNNVFQFEKSSTGNGRLVVEYKSLYLCAEVLPYNPDNDLIAIWTYPEEFKGLDIYTENPVILNMFRDHKPEDVYNKKLLNEITISMIHDYEVMMFLKTNELKVKEVAETIFHNELVVAKTKGRIMSHEAFVSYRMAIKADFQEKKLSKEDYTLKVTESYYARRNFKIVEIRAGYELQKKFDEVYNLTLLYRHTKLIFRYLNINNKPCSLYDYIIQQRMHKEPEKSKPKPIKKSNSIPAWFTYKKKYQQLILHTFEEESKLALTIDFDDQLLIAEFIQDPVDSDWMIVRWQSPVSLKGREFIFKAKASDEYPSNILKAIVMFPENGQKISEELADRLLLDYQFMKFVEKNHAKLLELYKRLRSKYTAFPNCRGALSKQAATVLKKQLVIQKKKGEITADERKQQLRQIEKDRRKYERIIRNTQDAMYRELKKVFGKGVYYSYFSTLDQLTNGQLPSDQLYELYVNQRIVN